MPSYNGTEHDDYASVGRLLGSLVGRVRRLETRTPTQVLPALPAAATPSVTGAEVVLWRVPAVGATGLVSVALDVSYSAAATSGTVALVDWRGIRQAESAAWAGRVLLGPVDPSGGRLTVVGRTDTGTGSMSVDLVAAWSGPALVDDLGGGGTDPTAPGSTTTSPGPTAPGPTAPGPTAPGPTATRPGSPTGASATAGNGSATISGVAPVSNGGAVILDYTATSSPGGLIGTAPPGTPPTVLGLTNGTTYTFTLTARNSVGSSAPSAPSNAVTPTSSTLFRGFRPYAGRPFSSTSYFNVPIPANPVLDPNSANMVAGLSAGPDGNHIVSLYDYGTPYWPADSSSPTGSVVARNASPSTPGGSWGTDPFLGLAVPLPTGVAPNAGTDGHMAIVDFSSGRSYEMWQATKVDATHWTCSWGAVMPDIFNGLGNERLNNNGSATAPETSLLAGCFRCFEARQGYIDHALSFASSITYGPTNYRLPALKSDGPGGDISSGAYPQANGVPEGTRIQLDPSLNLDAIPGIGRGELMLGKALQVYGAYCLDTGGARLSFGAENPQGDPAGDPWPGVGFAYDYYGLTKLPFATGLRVLRSWDGT